ncbi:hypothetical protein [Caballeronia novacaledonica]|uniref:hypothetical protein n=1 Tax=Caballeronia novacaledonica TaxID=1544861 RepID=UPI0011B1DB02|nr:hypothetical protein [Caballeronia novacaledonica]
MPVREMSECKKRRDTYGTDQESSNDHDKTPIQQCVEFIVDKGVNCREKRQYSVQQSPTVLQDCPIDAAGIAPGTPVAKATGRQS